MGKMAYIFGFFRLIWESAMNYTSVKYLALVILSVLFYYMIPRKYRWCVLLLSGIFFLISVSDGVGMILVFLFSALITWLAYGAVYSFLDQGVTFWQALVSPVALVFLALDIVFAFFAFTKKEAGT
jgi:hypothetical protein